jgi:hypothetical protein
MHWHTLQDALHGGWSATYIPAKACVPACRPAARAACGPLQSSGRGGCGAAASGGPHALPLPSSHGQRQGRVRRHQLCRKVKDLHAPFLV